MQNWSYHADTNMLQSNLFLATVTLTLTGQSPCSIGVNAPININAQVKCHKDGVSRTEVIVQKVIMENCTQLDLSVSEGLRYTHRVSPDAIHQASSKKKNEKKKMKTIIFLKKKCLEKK